MKLQTFFKVAVPFCILSATWKSSSSYKASSVTDIFSLFFIFHHFSDCETVSYQVLNLYFPND